MTLLPGVFAHTHIITYDLAGLASPERYNEIEHAIMNLGPYCKPLYTYWEIHSSLSCSTLLSILAPLFKQGDRLRIWDTTDGTSTSFGIPAGDLEVKTLKTLKKGLILKKPLGSEKKFNLFDGILQKKQSWE